MAERDPDLASVQQVRDLMRAAVEAQQRWATFSQTQIDAVIDAMAAAATANAEPLARMAVEETGYGNVPDKIKKNKFCSEDIYRAIRPMQTVGILRDDRENGVLEIAEPVGVVAAIIPSTNPTSTAIYKILISLKARNAVLLSPHPSAKKCICVAADILYKAALKAGAPEGIIGCLTQVTPASTQELMRHRRVGVILATGGTGLVRAAYSSGKPAYGVGPGNVPAYIERTANVRKAVGDVLTGKTFDYGTICSAEQAILAEESVRAAVVQELREQGAYFLKPAEIEAVGKLVIRPDTFLVNPKVVGRPAPVIAEMAGFAVPAATRVLVAELTGVGRDTPLSAEKLSPILALYTVRNPREAIELANRLLEFGGLGHTIVIHSQNDAVIREFAAAVRAFRVVVNSPAPHGSIGYSTRLSPAMTLGCGALGGNITSDNIGPQHLMNIKRVGYEVRPVERSEVQPVAAPRPAAVPAAPVRAVPATPPPSPAAPAAGAIPDRAVIARVVERFLAEKGVPRPAGAPATPPAAAAAPEVPPPPRAVDFVSENDVRAALERAERIFISPRTILTPSARDLGYAQNVFIETAPPARGKAARGE
jgi:acetaldehyde dehydrogenase (acetylating)